MFWELSLGPPLTGNKRQLEKTHRFGELLTLEGRYVLYLLTVVVRTGTWEWVKPIETPPPDLQPLATGTFSLPVIPNIGTCDLLFCFLPLELDARMASILPV